MRLLSPTLLVVVWLLSPAVVNAHAEFQTSSPKGGSTVPAPLVRVTIDFSEKLAANSHFEVLDASGATVAQGKPDPTKDDQMVAPTSALGPGTYTARWVSVALDKDVLRGTFTFTIAAAATPSPSPTPPPSSSGPSSPSASPSASASPAPSASAGPSPSSGTSPTSGATSDLAIPIVATLIVVGAIGLYVARRQRRA
jgi:copper resistance protein C